jgi:hypothetical protein
VAGYSLWVYDAAADRWTDKGRIPLQWPQSLAAAKVVRDGQARVELVGGYKPDNNLQYVP